MKKNKFYLGELFCGPGGMALGAKLANMQTSINGDTYSLSHVWGVDKDSEAILTYNSNELGEGVKCDALDFCQNNCIENLHKTIKDFRQITALAFGFPCNDFSIVGEKKGFHGKFGNLYKAGIDAINYSDPKWFVAENVSGIHSANSGDAFKKILSELQSSGKYGYNLSVNLYKFEKYGIPQIRHRYIIVGIRKDLKLYYNVPAPTHDDNIISVKEALSKPLDKQSCNNEKTNQSKRVIERLLFIPPWKNAWYLDKLLEMSPKNRREALKEAPWYEDKLKKYSDHEIKNRILNCKLNCTRARMSHIYRRLDKNKPSYTITGSGGGGTHVYHWEECRALTNRERARLQSFPDNFIFKGSKENVRKQIGMAVPPEGAKVIFEAVLKTFAGIEYEYVKDSYTENI